MPLRLHDLRPNPGARKARKRVGRGNASGKGTYSGRGLKGQRSRAGRDYNSVFEGGAMSMMRTLPKRRGFKNRNRIEYQAINVVDLARRFPPGATVDAHALVRARLLKRPAQPFKILAGGPIQHALHLRAERVSPAARAKILAAGGSVELIAGGSIELIADSNVEPVADAGDETSPATLS